MLYDEPQYGGLIDKYFILNIIITILVFHIMYFGLMFIIYQMEVAFWCNPPSFWEWLSWS